MQLLTSNSMLMMQKSMDYLWTKQTAILDNIANVETPNYKTKYVTFEEALKSKLESTRQSTVGIRKALGSAAPTVKMADETAKADGNGVDINEQSVELARNAFQQQHVYNAISTELSLLRTVSRGQ